MLEKIKTNKCVQAKKVASSQVEKDKLNEPWLPEEYCQLLTEVGWGDYGYFTLYEGPIFPDDIFPNFEGDINRFRPFLDVGDGYIFAFDIQNDCKIVEIDPWGKIEYRYELPLIDFLKDRFPELFESQE